MITIKDFMETIDYKVTEGSNYLWDCFGDTVHRFDHWNEMQDGHAISILFDTRTHTAYQMEAHDYANERSYRWTHPDYIQSYYDECDSKGVARNNAYDNVTFVELETAEDMLDKARSIFLGEEYDTRVSIPVDLPDDVLFELMRQAHEQDITLNEHMENIIRRELDKMKEELDDLGDDAFREKYQALLNTDSKKKKKKKKHD
jgi:hypothetical protein